MKVIQINSVCKSGSVAKIAIEIAKLLESNKHEASIAYGRGTASSEIKSFKFGSDIEVYLHGFLCRITDKHGLYSTHATYNLIHYLEKEKPDIVHLHCIHGYYVNYKVLFNYLKETKIPVVWTFHDCWSFTGHCAYFDMIDCRKWKSGCYDCPSKCNYPSSYLIDNSKENYLLKKEAFTGFARLVIVTPSKWLKELVHESFLSEYEVQVINNGIDASVFKINDNLDSIRKVYKKYMDSSILTNKKIILGVANFWTKRKGLEDFIKLNEILDDTYQVVLVGLTHRQIAGLPKGIIGIKRTDSAEELACLYNGAYAFLNLTYEDNYPTVNLEALACGTPVITYNTGGSGEMIENKTFVIPKGDLNGIKTVLINTELYVPMVSTRFDSKYCFQKYLDLYNNLAQRSV